MLASAHPWVGMNERNFTNYWNQISLKTSNDYANFWRYFVGVNVIPATGKHNDPKFCKKPFWTDLEGKKHWIRWTEYQDKPISEEQHEEWKKLNAFKDGLAIICGQVSHNIFKMELWFNAFDCDNLVGTNEWCPQGIKKTAEDTLTEQNKNKEKCHVCYYTEEPLTNRGAGASKDDNKPKIEVKSNGKALLYCSGTIHPNGSLIEIVGTREIRTLDKKQLEDRLEGIRKQYGIDSPKMVGQYREPLYKVKGKLYEGDNRAVHILSYLDSKKIKNPELTEEDLFYLARKYEKENCVGKYEDEKILGLVKQAMGFGEEKLTEQNEILEFNKNPKESEQLDRINKFGKPLDQVENYLNTKIKKDTTLVGQLVRVYLSTYTDNPINMALLAPSSDGKTYATVQVSKIFPKEDIILIGRLSPTALIHQTGFLIDSYGNPIGDSINQLDEKIANSKDSERKNFETQKRILLKGAFNCVDLKNKILLFLDNPNPATYDMLKPIMSHDAKEITYNTTKGDGSLTVKKTIIRNWPVFIFCSAKNEEKNEVWEEIKTRIFITSPNSDIEKYAEANRLTSKRFSRPTWGKGIYDNDNDKEWSKYYILEIKKKLTTLCKDYNNPVINPFDEILTENFPHNQGVSMRHFTRLMSFINLETDINSEYNPELIFYTKNNQITKSIFTTISDIDNASKVLKNISTISPEKIKFIDKVFKPRLEEELNCEELTSLQCAKKYTDVFGKMITSKQVLESYLKPLEDAGILTSRKNPDNISQSLFQITGMINIHNLGDLKSKLIEASKPNLSCLDSCLKELEEVSIEKRKSNLIFKYRDNVIDLSKLKKILIDDSPIQSKPIE